MGKLVWGCKSQWEPLSKPSAAEPLIPSIHAW
jgi:hypothetical protein